MCIRFVTKMKFKSFFKHTWQPQQMENAGRFSCHGSPPPATKQCTARAVNETELGELKSLPPENNCPSASASRGVGMACRNGACKGHGLRPPHHRIENPWHYLKTIFLVSMIFAFVVWIIVYVLLTQYDVV